MKIEITIPGQPPRVTNQSSVRHTRYGNGYKTKPLMEVEANYMQAFLPYRPEEKFSGPVKLDVEFSFLAKTKKANGTWKTTRPDTDNMVKTLKDVLTQCGYWNDDSQVAWESVKKNWSDNPKTKIIIETMEETNG